MENRRGLIIAGLMLLLVTLTAMAQDVRPYQGCRRGTPRPQSTHLRRGAALQGRMPGGDFYHGERHQLTVLVAYNDRSFKGDEAATMEQWNKIFNAENLSEAPFGGSVHDYFYAQSYGDFNLVFDLQYVQVSGDAERYASTEKDDENSQYLVKDIMDVLKTRDIDWSLYDWNGNGYVNQLLIICAGHSMTDSGEKNLIWPHQWWLSEHQKDRQPDVYCEPFPVSARGKDYLVDCYCALAEMTANNDYGTFGTICHEYTHCFGFPDFYCDGKSYLAGWELMDYGNFNGYGFLPPGYSAHERWLMEWLTPIELKEKTTVVNMPALADASRAYLIRNDGYENEYYIVENRQQKGWDACLPGNGIVVFHIDYSPSIWTSIQEYPNHPGYFDNSGKLVSPAITRYIIVAANNLSAPYYPLSSYFSGFTYPYDGNDELTNTSIPAATLNHVNSDGTLLMNKPLTQMAVTDGLASFHFMDDLAAVTQTTSETAAPQPIYRLGPVTFLRYPDGTVRKQIK